VNENDAYIFEVEEPKKWTFTGEPTWISGWFLSKVGAVFSDIRAVIDGVPHLGVLGLARPEIEQRHRGNVGLPHAGFVLRVNPPAGAKQLRLELRDAGHRWVEIWRTRIAVPAGENAPARCDLRLVPDQMRKLLQIHRADPRANLGDAAAELALDTAAVPLDILPSPPFFGALEAPGLKGGTQFGKVRLDGWLVHLEKRIARLTVSTHPLVENEMDFGQRERTDAAGMFPHHPYAGRSGFFGLADFDETASGPALVTIFAELEDGTRHLAFARRFHPRTASVWERPLPAFNRRLFFRTAWIFAGACRRQGIALGSPLAAWSAFASAYRELRRDSPRLPPAPEPDPYELWQRANAVTPKLRRLIESALEARRGRTPRISLLVDARHSDPERLAALAASLRGQIHSEWDACFIGARAPGHDPRLRHEACTEPKDFVRALNAAAHQATGTWLALIPADGRLPADALAQMAETIADRPGLELVYTDEDVIDDHGARSDPDFKPDWSPTLALSGIFPGQLSLIPRDRFVELGSFREGFDRVPWRDVLLRAGDRLAANQVAHLRIIGFHRWSGAVRELDLADPMYEQARAALADAARRRDWAASPFLPEAGHQRRRCFHQLRWDPGLFSRLPVTIVIPTRDRLHLLQECIELLDETVDWRFARLVIVDDHSRDADAVRYLARIQQRTDLRCTVVRLPEAGAPFNYSRLVNAALPHVDTPLILHLNNDVNVLEPGWLAEMSAWFGQPDVGVVGAKLVFPDKTLNHTGIVLGPHGGLADTPFAHGAESSVDLAWHAVAREVSAVTGACLMTRTEIYRQFGGFDETDFGVAYNDVDYCVRVRDAGFRVIFTPQAKLMHWGSATRGVTFDEAEHIAWVHRHPPGPEPYFSPHWRLEDGRVRCRGDLCNHAGRTGPLRLLLLTHNFNFEGAPLFLLEYATYLVRVHGFHLQILSGRDGPLRPAFEALGAQVTLVDTREIYGSPDEEVLLSRVDDVGEKVDWEAVDLVVCNTLACFWGVLLARQRHRPSLLYIHESTSIFRFFELTLKLPLHAVVGRALEEATRVLFLCRATQAYYDDHNRNGNFRIVPSWIRVRAIDEFRRANARDDLRRRHGLPVDEIIIANIGTVCERKGQHVFIRAVDHFNHHYHGATPVRFLMVGARPGIYLDLLQRDLARMGLTNITFVPETGAAFDYFALADMFVCTSFEESFPRVVLEAMAFRTPIVSTDVHGVAEMVRQRAEAYLVRPGDVAGLSRMMRTCLAKERSGKSLTPTAYSRVLRLYNDAQVLPRHAELAREASLAEA
jgi:glycosyltransferase involved in cell wall biosynthesis